MLRDPQSETGESSSDLEGSSDRDGVHSHTVTLRVTATHAAQRSELTAIYPSLAYGYLHQVLETTARPIIPSSTSPRSLISLRHDCQRTSRPRPG